MEALLAELFDLTTEAGSGVACDEKGFFVGEVALVECDAGTLRWRPRRLSALNQDLTKCYGLSVEMDSNRAARLKI
jgi:hypothetical protein